MTIDLGDAIEHIDIAVDALLTARVALGGGGDLAVPEEALTAALQADDDYVEARQHFVDALGELRATGADVLDLEAAVNAVVFGGAVAGWRLGRLVRPRG